MSADPAPLLSDELAAAAAKGLQADLTRSAEHPLVVDRPIARAGAWYEMMPRSQGRLPDRHGTFDDGIARLPEIAALGFDVLYLPRSTRSAHQPQGRNNALTAAAGDPGSPCAIGLPKGATTRHPELGTLEDFRRLVKACAETEWKSRSISPSNARRTIPG